MPNAEVVAEIPKPATTDVMLTSPEWRYMQVTLPDKKRPVREEIGAAFSSFLKRLNTVWSRKTKGIGEAHVEAQGDGESVRVRFQLHGQDALAAVFRTNKIFFGQGGADAIVDTVIAHKGGLQQVMRMAEDILPTITAEIIPEKATKKRAVKKSKSTKGKIKAKSK